jgi:SAM-dependent methyltransferase
MSPAAPGVACKVCGGPSRVAFALPASKLTGQPIPDKPSDCPYFECEQCHFLFSTVHDRGDQAALYDDAYWNQQDPDWHGRVNQTLRLVLLANRLLAADPWRLRILDFGCGMGTFVQTARESLDLQVWGTDLIRPRFGLEHFLREPPERSFDLVVACEVIEHLPDPMEAMRRIRRTLVDGGVFAFQTAYYDRGCCGRDWWYLGPANGHISLYSPEALDRLFAKLGGTARCKWNDYAGIQAWRLG